MAGVPHLEDRLIPKATLKAREAPMQKLGTELIELSKEERK